MNDASESLKSANGEKLFADRKTFSEIKEQDKTRVCNSYDSLGRVDGTITVTADGQSVSTFMTDFETYRVVREKSGIRVFKLGFAEFEPLLDAEEVSVVLRREKAMFSRTHIVSGV